MHVSSLTRKTHHATSMENLQPTKSNRQNLVPDPCFYPEGVTATVTGRGTIAVRTSSAGHT